MLKECVLIEPFKCDEDDSIVAVAKKLRSSKIRHIFVVDSKDYPIGIISTTDINNRAVAEGKDPNKVAAKDIMSKPIEVYDIEEEALKVYRSMAKNKRLLCAVTKNKKFVGMLSIDALLHCITHPK